MDENEFKKLFSADELNELHAAAEQAEAEGVAPTKNGGVWYDGDEGQFSRYAVNMGGKTVVWVMVNNDVVLSPAQHGLQIPAEITIHPIHVLSADRNQFVVTKGFAARYLHDDGTGVHVDGNTVRAYVAPRISHWLGHFYGV